MKRFGVGLLFWMILVSLLGGRQSSIFAQQQTFAGVVSNTSTDDGFLFYDVNAQSTRLVSFGDMPHVFGGFSPDGCQIVFTLEQQPGNADLFVANIDGSDLRQVMFPGRQAALSYRVFEPTWSPDGQRIAFTLMRYFDPIDEDPYRRTHIAWVPPEGAAPTFYSSSGYEYQPRWSPDGNALVYVSEQPMLFDAEGNPIEVDVTEADDLPRYPEVWLVDARGQSKERLTNLGEIGAYNPRFSPNGQQLAFVIQPFENSHRLLVLNLNTRSALAINQTLITILDYAWQPDGTQIVVAAQGLNDVPQNRLWQLQPLHHSESSATLIQTEQAFLDYPRFSPDGNWLAARGGYEMIVLDTTSNSLQHSDPLARHNSPPVWAPQACSP